MSQPARQICILKAHQLIAGGGAGAPTKCPGAGAGRRAGPVCQPGRLPAGASHWLLQLVGSAQLLRLLAPASQQHLSFTRTNEPFATCCLQIQLAVPAGYSRNGVPITRNFTFHACLGPTSRQQVCSRLGCLGWPREGLCFAMAQLACPTASCRMCYVCAASPSCWMPRWMATTPQY